MKKVMILLSAYNGEKYIAEQIDSLVKQVGVEPIILVRDDGSSDNTVNILKDYEIRGLIKWYTGDNLRPLKSFMDLLARAKDCDYYAFCDQDDVWLPEKLLKSVNKMESIESQNPNCPVLVHTDMYIVNENLEITNQSFWKYSGIRPDYLSTFEYLSVFNGVNGCTILLNNEARTIILQKMFHQECVIHDVLCTLLVAGNNGIIGYVSEPTMLYRQHSSNVVGAKKFGFRYLIKKVLLIPHAIKKNYLHFKMVNHIKRYSAISYLYHKINYLLHIHL